VKEALAPFVVYANCPRTLVRHVLAEDARHRVPGVTDGLFGLDDLAGLPRRRLLGCGVPVLAFADQFGPGGPWAGDMPESDGEFAKAFLECCGGSGPSINGIRSFLSGFDLQAHGLVVAGGFPAAILAGMPAAACTARDVDLFLVGHPNDAARAAAIVALFRHLLRGRAARIIKAQQARVSNWGEGEDTWGIVVHRTRGCITFTLSGEIWGHYKPIQVVLRAYSSVSEVLHGFDLGAAQVAFDGKRVYLTTAGVLAATRGANVLNLAVRRVSYEARLVRYLVRGYDLAVPDLDVKAVRALEQSPLPGTVVDEAPRGPGRDRPGCCRVRLSRALLPSAAKAAQLVARAWAAGATAPPDGPPAGGSAPDGAAPDGAPATAPPPDGPGPAADLTGAAACEAGGEIPYGIALAWAAGAAAPPPDGAGAAAADLTGAAAPTPAARMAAEEAAIIAAADGPGPVADYAGAADYAGGEIPYGNLDEITLRNARLLGAPRWGEAGGAKADGAKAETAEAGGAKADATTRPPALRDPGALLCAVARTTDEDFDVLGFALDPFPDFELFMLAAFGKTRGGTVLPSWRAEIILGPNLAGRPGRLRAAPPALLRRLWEARRDLAREALAAAGFGPAAFAPVADRTALSGDPRYATTPAEWLGPLFAGPAE
jgi:hypothetical protein